MGYVSGKRYFGVLDGCEWIKISWDVVTAVLLGHDYVA